MAKSTPNPTKASRKSNARPPGGKPRAALQDEALRKIRALTVVQQRVQGVSIAEIAKGLNVHPDTVDNDIAWAKKAGLLETLEQRLLGTIANKTLAVIEGHLDLGNLDAAKEGMKFIIHAHQQKARREEKQEARDFDLEEYLREKRRGAVEVTSEPVPQHEGPEGAVLQGRLAGAPEGAAPGGASADGPGPVEDPGLDDDAAGRGAGPGDPAGDGA